MFGLFVHRDVQLMSEMMPCLLYTCQLLGVAASLKQLLTEFMACQSHIGSLSQANGEQAASKALCRLCWWLQSSGLSSHVLGYPRCLLLLGR
jgi:hypothetical protein